MIRRFLSALVIVAVATGVYMPYSHGVSAGIDATSEHMECAGHETAPDSSHVSECLSGILLKDSFGRPAVSYEAPARETGYPAISPYSYILPPGAVGALPHGPSPPGFFALESRPAVFIAVTVLLV